MLILSPDADDSTDETKKVDGGTNSLDESDFVICKDVGDSSTALGCILLERTR